MDDEANTAGDYAKLLGGLTWEDRQARRKAKIQQKQYKLSAHQLRQKPSPQQAQQQQASDVPHPRIVAAVPTFVANDQLCLKSSVPLSTAIPPQYIKLRYRNLVIPIPGIFRFSPQEKKGKGKGKEKSLGHKDPYVPSNWSSEIQFNFDIDSWRTSYRCQASESPTGSGISLQPTPVPAKVQHPAGAPKITLYSQVIEDDEVQISMPDALEAIMLSEQARFGDTDPPPNVDRVRHLFIDLAFEKTETAKEGAPQLKDLIGSVWNRFFLPEHKLQTCTFSIPGCPHRKGQTHTKIRIAPIGLSVFAPRFYEAEPQDRLRYRAV